MTACLRVAGDPSAIPPTVSSDHHSAFGTAKKTMIMKAKPGFVEEPAGIRGRDGIIGNI
jgi:hypothetical protein